MTANINTLLGSEKSYLLKLSSYGYKIYWNFEFDSLKFNHEIDKQGKVKENDNINTKIKQISDPTSIDIPLNEKIFKDAIESQEVAFLSDSKQLNDVVNRYFLIKPKNIMIIPIIDHENDTKGIIMATDVNKEVADKTGHSSNQLSVDFTLKILSCQILSKIYFDLNEKKELLIEMKHKREIITRIYSEMLSFKTIWELIEYIESSLCQYFKVNRVNFLLCDHLKNELYKVVQNGKTHEQKIVSYDSEKGLAKSVANDGSILIANSAHKSKKFFAQIDDPKGNHPVDGIGCEPTSILSIPVYKRGENIMNANCIAVLQLINKKDGTPFDEYNAEEAENFVYCLGEIVQNIHKVEQLVNYKNLMEHLDKFIDKTSKQMISTVVQYDSLKKSLKELKKRLAFISV